MGEIHVHEFMSLDGVIDAPTWTADYRSGTLVRAMLADSLVDELHLFVYPLTPGSGPRPFSETATPGSFSPAAVSHTRMASCTWPTGPQT